jgi:hypothetical protein
MNGDKDCPINPLATYVVYAEGNMEKIVEMIPIDISRTPGIMENIFSKADCSPEEIQLYTDLFKEFCDVLVWSYEEMLGIDPRIVEHESRLILMSSWSDRSFIRSILGKKQLSRLK